MDDKHFDAVIIGSGFGGSVMAYRLAEAGLRVCLLERGKAFPPNSFPRAPYKLRNNFWDPSEGLYGMYNVWSFKGSGALVSSGLGGGSLIYANIIIRKDEEWFVRDLDKGGYENWVVTRKDLDPHYDRVDRMMNVQKYPLCHKPYDKTMKTHAMIEAAEKLKRENPNETVQWLPLNLAVSFRQRHVGDPDNPDDVNNPPLVGEPIIEERENYHKRTRYTCVLCGECDFGCNTGSKNTLDYTYITAAHHAKADIRPLCEVKSFAPLNNGKGYQVTYIHHDPEKWDGQKVDTGDPKLFPPQTITCDRLIISAGTFGSPFLLFKNKAAFPNLSPMLGKRFCVNGDLLAFIVNSSERKNGKTAPRVLDPNFGPVITSAIRLGDTLDGLGEQGRGFYVEDGGNPYLLSWGAELTGFFNLLRRLFHFNRMRLNYYLGFNKDANLNSELANLIGDCDVSKSSLPFLTMGRDIPNGVLSFDGKYLDCDWKIRKSQDYYDRVIRILKGIADALNAKYMDNPSYQYLRQVITAHPLGGCPMGDDKNNGVVDSYGEVFGYPGLYVMDGSIMPGPVGPNPSMTIAAISDRAADYIIDRHKGIIKEFKTNE
ncbi:MAG TPA: GMC family oxidoreductase [Pyrinomonadaceae bacterium]|jgi:cholesterol oxidase